MQGVAFCQESAVEGGRGKQVTWCSGVRYNKGLWILSWIRGEVHSVEACDEDRNMTMM